MEAFRIMQIGEEEMIEHGDVLEEVCIVDVACHLRSMVLKKKTKMMSSR